LLEKVGVRFEVLAVPVDECARAGELPGEFARRMAEEKAAAATQQRRDSWILAADTVVALGDLALGKPRDHEDAVAMLTRLSGREHVVYTGVVLLRPGAEPAAHTVVETRVTFRPLDASEIQAYIETGEPFDRAGAYAIQGEGAHLVDRVEGSYTNVIGLPVAEVAGWLRTWRII
jgi:septum formation protein